MTLEGSRELAKKAIQVAAKKGFLAFRAKPELKHDIEQIKVDDEQRNITQVCELLLHEGVEAIRRKGLNSCGAWLPTETAFGIKI